ncbi:response regulator [Leucobacter albus]|uniref:Response regulator n=1 Tax=Leucobacter albus TaxID=272210 RepID=A0ABW3TI63_9MICO
MPELHRPLRVALAEDSVLLREGLIRLFDEAGYDTVLAVGDAELLLAGLDEAAPDLVILDVRMPPTFTDEGVRAAIEIRRRAQRPAVLLLSQYVEVVYAAELLAGGAEGVGYLLKDRVVSLDELEDAVARVSRGGTVLDPHVVRELMSRRSDPISLLTARETEVLAAMAEGRSNQEIAATLVVGQGAVEKHISQIFQKLALDDSQGGHRRVLAVLAWLQRG